MYMTAMRKHERRPRRVRLLATGLAALIVPAAFTAPAAAAEPPEAITVVEVTASSSDGNLPESTIDGDLTTRWSAQTTDPAGPEWIRWDLGEIRQVGYLGLAWHQGDRRTSQFDLQVSDDGATWTTVVAAASSGGETVDLEAVELGVPPESGLQTRYLRYLGHGNSSGNGWNSINDVRVYPPNPDGAVVEELASSLPEPDPDAEPWTTPGLVEPDGEPYALTPPAPATGQTVNVLDHGADPADGTGDDAAAIRAAVAAAEPGDEVYLPPGVYDLDTTVPADPTTNIALRSGIHLRGAGADETILRSALTPQTPSGKVLRGMGITDVVVADLTVTSTFDGEFSDDPSADAGGGPAYGIFVSNLGVRPSLRVVIDAVTVERYQRMGVRIEKSRDVEVRGSTFRDATSVGGGGAGYGVTIQGTPLEDRYAYPDDSRHNVVRDNTFEGPYLRHAILLQYYTHNNLVVGNRITGTVLDAIDLHGEDEYLNEVRGNTVISSRAAGIALGNTGGTATQHDASGPGNWIHGNVLQGNREGVLVHIGSPDTLIENNVVVRGHRSPARVGIEVRHAPRTVVRANTITGNRADGFWGIRLTDDPGDDGHGAGIPTDVLIDGNVVAANSNGVRIDAGSGIVLDDNIVRGNTGEQVRIDDDADVVTEGEPGGDPACDAPSDILDLTDWKLTLPVDDPDEDGQQPLEITQPELDGYTAEPWFVPLPDCDGVRFRNSVDGVTTPNSSYSRSELREMTDGGSELAGWSSTSGTHTMVIDQAITHLPNDKPHVVAGQIHDSDDDVTVFRLQGTSLYVTDGNTSTYHLITDEYELGTRFEAKFVVSDGAVRAYYNGEYQTTIEKDFDGAYFKAGAYTQANCGNSQPCDSSNFGEVVVYDVTVTHE